MNWRQRAWIESRLETLKELQAKEIYAARLLRAVQWLKRRKMKQLGIISLVVVCVSCSSVKQQDALVSIKPRLPNLSENKVAFATTPKKRYVMWNEEGLFRVYTGPARFQWTTNFLVTTNQTEYKSGLHYGVVGLWYGKEEIMAFYPSNRIAELRAVGTNYNQVLLRYTNNPVAPSQFWTIPQGAKIVDVTVGYN